LTRHWRRDGPPTHVAVAAYLGLRQPVRNGVDALGGQDLVNFLSAFPGGDGRA